MSGQSTRTLMNRNDNLSRISSRPTRASRPELMSIADQNFETGRLAADRAGRDGKRFWLRDGCAGARRLVECTARRAICLLVLGAALGAGTRAAAEWQQKQPVPAARGVRFLYQAPVATAGRIYVIHGGQNRLSEYDPARDSWVTFPAPVPTQRYHHATAALDGKIYAIAGSVHGEPREWVSAVEEFDPATGAWRSRAPLPGPRRNAGAVALGGRLYVVGGEGADTSAMPIASYDPSSDTWTQQRAATRVRQCWGAQVIDGRIYVLGNTGREEPPAPVLDEYDPVTDTVVARAPLPRPRLAFATAVADGRLLVLGGSPGANVPLGQVDIYDPRTDTWSPGPDLPEPKCWLGAITCEQTLYVLGGIAGDWTKADANMRATSIDFVATPSP